MSADALYSVGLWKNSKFSFCKIYTVFVGNLFYRLAHKKNTYAVCWKASNTSKTFISKRWTLGEPFDFKNKTANINIQNRSLYAC